MKAWLQRAQKIARAHFPSGESYFPTDVPRWDSSREEEAGKQKSGRVEEVCSQEEAKYYANLELPVGSAFAEIKHQYRALLRQYHPDLYAKASPEKQVVAKEITAQLNMAYEYFRGKYQDK